jgi:hypothetical protein
MNSCAMQSLMDTMTRLLAQKVAHQAAMRGRGHITFTCDQWYSGSGQELTSLSDDSDDVPDLIPCY